MTMPETIQSDLVERLRAFKLDDSDDYELAPDAAAEIERLTEELRGMTINRDNLRRYLLERKEERDAARDQAEAARKAEGRAREAAKAILDSTINGAEINRLRAHCEAMSRALETAERQITAAFGIIHPGNDDLLEGSLESIRQPLAAYRGENADG